MPAPHSSQSEEVAHSGDVVSMNKLKFSAPGEGVPFVCSWSGGKDSSLALYRAVSVGAKPTFLFTMLDESGKRSRSHALPLEVLEAQAFSLGIPLRTASASWSEYEAVFIATLQELAECGVEVGVFGDIDIDSHREWEEMVCGQAEMQAYLPLWKTPREHLLNEFLTLGFEGMIIVTKATKLGKEYLGKKLDRELIEQFRAVGVDPSGEAGEYHTVVTNGPLYSETLNIVKGNTIRHSGYWFLDITLVE